MDVHYEAPAIKAKAIDKYKSTGTSNDIEIKLGKNYSAKKGLRTAHRDL